MPKDDFLHYLKTEYNQPFSGWDFSYLTGRWEFPPTPTNWNYNERVRTEMRQIESMLDMGTGGGELLASLQPLPPSTYVTEGYAPNVPIARTRLEPLGVKVYDVTGDYVHLPFADDQFDLVINRHEAYEPREVLRILKPGHQFITQQVGAQENAELNTFFGAESYPYAHWTLAYAVKELQEAGWHVLEQKEQLLPKRFFDAGAVVYYLKAISWQIPDFTIEKYFDKLVELDELIRARQFFEVHDHFFFIVAQKP